jgi:hypothetical protein
MQSATSSDAVGNLDNYNTGIIFVNLAKGSTLKCPAVTVGLLALLTSRLAKVKRFSLSCHSIRDKAP